MNYFKERRTVRKFEDRPVDKALIADIVEAAAKAPTCGNMQLYSVILSSTPEQIAALAPLHFNQPAATGAKYILTVCADFNRFTRWCELRNADAAYDNLLSFTSAVTDAVIFAQQIITIAEMRGLGTCWLGTVTYNAPDIARQLNLPDLTMPVAAIAIGWPAEKGTETERLPLPAILHDGEYHRFSDSEILDLYRTKEEYPANLGYPAENGKENLAQVFAEVRYPRALNESVSASLAAWLKEQRFLPK